MPWPQPFQTFSISSKNFLPDAEYAKSGVQTNHPSYLMYGAPPPPFQGSMYEGDVYVRDAGALCEKLERQLAAQDEESTKVEVQENVAEFIEKTRDLLYSTRQELCWQGH